MAVPEKRHFFQQRRSRCQHSFEPPTSKIENIFALHTMELALSFFPFLGRDSLCPHFHADLTDLARMRPRGWRDIGEVIARIDQIVDRHLQALSGAADFGQLPRTRFGSKMRRSRSLAAAITE
jgi:hypothetical protein